MAKQIMPAPSHIYIGLGANVGDRTGNLHRAREEMHKNEMVIARQSSLYQTEAWGFQDQDPFLNQVIEITTLLSPEHLLHRLKAIEKKMGRQKRKKWHEREIDLDILYYGHRILNTSDLQIPHPYVRERNFVLVPLSEIAAEFTDPETGMNINEIAQLCTDPAKVVVYNPGP